MFPLCGWIVAMVKTVVSITQLRSNICMISTHRRHLPRWQVALKWPKEYVVYHVVQIWLQGLVWGLRSCYISGINRFYVNNSLFMIFEYHLQRDKNRICSRIFSIPIFFHNIHLYRSLFHSSYLQSNLFTKKTPFAYDSFLLSSP